MFEKFFTSFGAPRNRQVLRCLSAYSDVFHRSAPTQSVKEELKHGESEMVKEWFRMPIATFDTGGGFSGGFPTKIPSRALSEESRLLNLQNWNLHSEIFNVSKIEVPHAPHLHLRKLVFEEVFVRMLTESSETKNDLRLQSKELLPKLFPHISGLHFQQPIFDNVIVPKISSLQEISNFTKIEVPHVTHLHLQKPIGLFEDIFVRLQTQSSETKNALSLQSMELLPNQFDHISGLQFQQIISNNVMVPDISSLQNLFAIAIGSTSSAGSLSSIGSTGSLSIPSTTSPGGNQAVSPSLTFFLAVFTILTAYHLYKFGTIPPNAKGAAYHGSWLDKKYPGFQFQNLQKEDPEVVPVMIMFPSDGLLLWPNLEDETKEGAIDLYIRQYNKHSGKVVKTDDGKVMTFEEYVWRSFDIARETNMNEVIADVVAQIRGQITVEIQEHKPRKFHGVCVTTLSNLLFSKFGVQPTIATKKYTAKDGTEYHIVYEIRIPYDQNLIDVKLVPGLPIVRGSIQADKATGNEIVFIVE